MTNELANAYRRLGRKQAALELAQENLAICEKSLDETDGIYLDALEEVARAYRDVGRYKESIDLLEKALVKRTEIFNEEDADVLYSEYALASSYSVSGRHQAALDIFQSVLEKDLRVWGQDHPDTLKTMVSIATSFGKMNQPEKGIPLMIKALDVGSRIGLNIEQLQRYKVILEWLQSESEKSPTTVPQRLPISQKSPHSGRKLWRLWPRNRHRQETSPS